LESERAAVGSGLVLKSREKEPLLCGLRIAGTLAVGATLEAVAAGSPEELARGCRFQWQR
jgi:hypothetical protein